MKPHRRAACAAAAMALAACSRPSEPAHTTATNAPPVAVDASPSHESPVALPATTSSTPFTTSQATGPERANAPPERLEVSNDQRYDPEGPGKHPLVIVLHGLGATGKLAFDALHLQEFGERTQSHVVAPDGTLDSRGQRFWNAGPACCNFDGRPVDDVARVGALITEGEASGGVDPTRVSVVGLSNGGFMAHRLGCELGDRLANVVSIAGAGFAEGAFGCHLSAPLGVLEIHGDADPIVRYEGGSVFDRPDLPHHPSATATLSLWGKLLGCQGEPAAGAHFDLVSSIPGEETATFSYRKCARGDAELWTIHGGKHIPPLSGIMGKLEPFLLAHHR